MTLDLSAFFSTFLQFLVYLIEAGHQYKIIGLGIVATGIVKISTLNRQLIDDELYKFLFGSRERGFQAAVLLLDIGGLQRQTVGFIVRDKMAPYRRRRAVLVPLDDPRRGHAPQ